MAIFSQGKEGLKGFTLQRGLLFRKGKLVVDPATPFHAKILQHVHDNPEVGHMGYHKTLHRAKLDF